MRTRPVWLAAAVAAAGLAAIGAVMAQPPGGSYPPPVPPGPPGTLPATTVRQYSGWTPYPPPPGYTPRQPATGVQPAGGTKSRLTQPVMAGPDGVRPAGGFELPPPNMDLPAPTFRPGTGAAPPPGIGVPPSPSLLSDSVGLKPPTNTKFPAVPAPVLPPPPTAGTTPAVPLPPESPMPAYAPAVPVPPSPAAPPATPAVKAPSPFPVAGPTGPAAPGAVPPPSVSLTPPAGVAPPAVPGAKDSPATPNPAAFAAGLLPPRTTPSVTVEAVCPESVVYGQEFSYKLIVRNTGTTAVSNVRVDDELPPGARYVGSDPVAELSGDHLVWLLGTLDSGAEKQITVRVKPADEGEARSRATVMFAAAVDARTRVTRPRLSVAVSGAEVCRAGEETSFQIKVTNSGSGPAAGAVVRAQLSDGLLHSQGVVIEAPLDKLPAGEAKIIQLKVAAAKAGLQWCRITVSGDGSPDATAKASTNVVEPMLVVKQTGPAHCLVRAEPTYTIELSNPGTAATDPVLLQTVLPDGFEWINQASDGGTCNGRTVVWRLPSLGAGSNRTVTVKLRASAATDPQGSLLRTVAQAGPAAVAPAGGPAAGGAPVRPAGRTLEAKAETAIVAEGVAAVRFDVLGLENPVSVGKEVTYEIRVMNQGTGACSNVRVAATLAEGTEFVAATTGNNQGGAAKADGRQLTFDPIPSLGVKGEVVYRVRVKGTTPGDLRFRVQLSCDQLKTPLVKEESTTFVKE